MSYQRQLNCHVLIVSVRMVPLTVSQQQQEKQNKEIKVYCATN